MAGLYIHVPFCHGKCAYCDFYSVIDTSVAEAYAGAVIAEIGLRRHEVGDITTLYIGGGTPSILAPRLLRRITAAAEASNVREFTIEVNPEDVTDENVRAWTDMGVNRVSMGVQTFDDTLLNLIGRRHTATEAVNAYEILRRNGVRNVSLDLIYGLPGQSVDGWRESVDRLMQLAPEHFSAYSLTYEPRTRLSALLRAGRITAVNDDDVARMYGYLTDTARIHGYEHYEISNFARPGLRSAHNSAYWDFTPYLGVGPGAHSFDGELRRVNPSDVRGYIDTLAQGRTVCEIDEEDDDNRFNDLLFTALRTSEGLDFGRVKRRRRQRLLCDMYPYLESGRVEVCDGRFVIPERYWLVSDSIISDLLQVH